MCLFPSQTSVVFLPPLASHLLPYKSVCPTGFREVCLTIGLEFCIGAWRHIHQWVHSRMIPPKYYLLIEQQQVVWRHPPTPPSLSLHHIHSWPLAGIALCVGSVPVSAVAVSWWLLSRVVLRRQGSAALLLCVYRASFIASIPRPTNTFSVSIEKVLKRVTAGKINTHLRQLLMLQNWAP